MERIRLLDHDPDLAEGLSAQQRSAAASLLEVTERRLSPGLWRLEGFARGGVETLGVLVLEGALMRSLVLEGRVTAQLFGPPDVLRPWSDAEDLSPRPIHTTWTTLIPTRVAILDREFTVVAAQWPALLAAVSARREHEIDRVAFQVAVMRMPRIDDRLLIMFWRMGQIWGRVTPAGRLIPLPLTHEAIAAIVGGSRPPVSAGIGKLARDGLLTRVEAGWLLSHEAVARASATLEADGQHVA
jgi:CRP/FNR family transcriptional regulator, cyclic AMP receptor protein